MKTSSRALFSEVNISARLQYNSLYWHKRAGTCTASTRKDEGLVEMNIIYMGLLHWKA